MRPPMNMVVGSCARTRDQLSADLEGELTGLGSLRVRLHLAGCDACTAVARSLPETIERLRELGNTDPEPVPSVVPAVLERIRRRGPQ